MSADDTIYALSSGSGRAAISVIRLSGKRARHILDEIAGRVGPPRQHCLRTIRNPVSGERLDEGIVVWMPGPKSFTGEDCAELHVHASRAVQLGLFETLSQFDGVRLAEPGEFTRRAVLNGKMDLVEAEGLGDLLAAQTGSQRRQALCHMLGEASSVFDAWRERLLQIRSNIEAVIDFSDEAGVADEAGSVIDTEIRVLLTELEKAISDAAGAEAIRDGVRIVLAGLPNTGKSSLLNAIARREAAIVSAIPGTTRDVIEVVLDMSGIAVVLADTAGLRTDAIDEIELEGINRTRREVEIADIVVWVSSPDVVGSEIYEEDVSPAVVVFGKSDQYPESSGLFRNESVSVRHVALSAKTGVGMTAFIGALTEVVKAKFETVDVPVVVSSRQKQATEESIRCLNDSLRHDLLSLELKAEDIRRAAEATGRITGRTEVEEWLGAIFSKFCIGK